MQLRPRLAAVERHRQGLSLLQVGGFVLGGAEGPPAIGAVPHREGKGSPAYCGPMAG